ncbi:YdcF family protein [Pseudoalteromonas apostichopi]|uniref:YdcF family protein n=1 Tax=Pseudoalteromonas apostichopi TaxID=3035452 RepID=UPI0025727169|nr:YdcF family protein [Pseudoalteromonas sp. FE4]
MNNAIIVVLGSTNDKHGSISRIGLSRLDKGLEIYKKQENSKILLTGGYSKGKKVAEHPYSYYAKQLILKKGVIEEDIIGLVMSKDTVEDAKLSVPYLKHVNDRNIIIITSDFHMRRTKYIFNKIFKGKKLYFIEAEYKASDAEISALTETEEKELALLMETGKSSIGSKL